MRLAQVLLILAAAVWQFAAAAQEVGDAAQNQWFTGSLVAPSPALPKAGLFAVEPYAIFAANTRAFNGNWGHYSVPHDLNQVLSVTVLKYGITHQLSVQALSSLSYQWKDQTASRGASLDDLLVELQYLFKDGNSKTGSPSATVEFGMTFPIGAYERLRSPLDGVGSGAYLAKEGLLLESLSTHGATMQCACVSSLQPMNLSLTCQFMASASLERMEASQDRLRWGPPLRLDSGSNTA